MSSGATADSVVCADAIDFLRTLADGSIDAIISDPPYNMTKLDFEVSIDWISFWQQARRVLRMRNSPVILFSQQPFTTDLIMSNRKGWRYEIIWEKTMPVGFLDANRRPLRCHENIQIFADAAANYNPIMEQSNVIRATNQRRGQPAHYGTVRSNSYVDDGSRYPRSVWKFAQRHNAFENTKTLHPTEKPVVLMERLIETYTNVDDTILDCFAGSGSTLVAAQHLGRRFYGCDNGINSRTGQTWADVANGRLAEPFTPMLFSVPASD